MRAVRAVLAWELREKKSAFLAAFIASLLPLAAPILTGVTALDIEETRDVIALSTALAFTAALALMYGSTMVSREMKERRIGFFFSKPIASAAIWWGKTLAGVAIAVSCWVIIIFPSMLVGITTKKNLVKLLLTGNSSWIISLVVLFGSLFLICIAHALSLALRSRSMFILLDLGALILASVIIFITVDILVKERAVETTQWTMSILAFGLLLAFVVAGQSSLVHGRTDIRRSHFILSLVLWSGFGVVCLGALLFSLWLRSVTPRDLVTLEELVYSPKGNWVVVGGRARYRGDHYPKFVFNPQTQQSIRVRSLQRYWSGVALADSGVRAAWFAPEGFFWGDIGQLMTVDLTRPEAEAVPIPIVLNDPERVSLILSSDGQRLAILERDKVVVYETLTGETQAVARLDEDMSCDARFILSNDRLRLLCWRKPSSREGFTEHLAYEFDIPTKKLTSTGPFARYPRQYWGVVRPNSEWTRLLLSQREAEGVRFTLLNADNGAMLASWSVGARATGQFLADGRIVVANKGQSTTTFYLYSKDGLLEKSFSIEQTGWTWLGGELKTGRIVVTFSKKGWITDHSLVQTLLVDLDSGEARELAKGYQPATEYFWQRSGPVEVASAASKLFIGPHGELATLDPLSGQFTEVLSTKSR